MKTCVLSTLTLAVLMGLALLSSGCRRGSESELVRRARLVGQENIELKKELRERDAQIARQKALVAECQEEAVKAQMEAGETNLQLLQKLAATDEQLQTLREENQRLQEKLAGGAGQ